MISPVRLLLVDDHLLFRESIARLLEHEADLEIVGQCATLSEVRRCIANTSPDIVLLDYDLGAERGTDLLEFLQQHDRSLRILMVTGGVDSSTTRKLLEAGIAGVVLKHSEPRHLLTAVRRVATGGTWWDVDPARALASAPLPSDRTLASSLTQRQQMILRLILDGLTNKEIAGNLQISETAVKASIQELFAKAGVRSRSQLVRIAVEKHGEDWLSSENG